jgi:AcrR family transcriptional regulator
MARSANTRNGTARRQRGSLSENEILAAAILIVERDGLDELSMPVLANHLGAGVMSIYWYFRTKDDLLKAMADRALEEVYSGLPAPGDGPWEDELVRLFTAFYKALQRAPLYLELCRANPNLLHPRSTVVPALARRLEAEVEVLQHLGLPAADALRLHSILSSYTLGMVLMQQAKRPDDDTPTPEEALRGSAAQLDPAKYPTLHALNDVGAIISVGDGAFATSLQLFVAGIRAKYSGV